MKISGYTNVLAVVGNPVRHSLSPKLHNFLSEKLGRDYVYTAFEPSSFDGVAQAIKTLGIRGVNVTAPFKYDALASVDVVSENARCSGSVNTIVNEGGTLVGYSTDGEGLYLSMKHAGISTIGKKVMVLGAGGAAKPICVMLKNRGADKVVIKNRTEKRAALLAEDLNRIVNTDIFSVYSGEKSFDLIINTTSVGMGTQECSLDDISLISGAEAVVDIIYYPKKTALLRAAESMGVKILNGIGMLAFQGIIAYEYFTGEKVSEEYYTEALNIIDE